MQPTTMTDINEMQKDAPTATFVTNTEPDNMAEVTTAPQQELTKLDSQTPKQPIGNQTDNQSS